MDRAKAGAVVTKKATRPQLQPTRLGRRRGATGWDPFYQFEKIARDHGPPPEQKPPKGELLLLEILSSKTAAIVMGGLLVVVVLVLLVLLVFRG